MRADPEKTKIIEDWPRPQTVKEVKSFLQTVQFNNIYMAAEREDEKTYPGLTAPFRALTKRGVKFSWNEELEENFKIIRAMLASDRVMVP